VHAPLITNIGGTLSESWTLPLSENTISTLEMTCPVPLPVKDTVLLGHGSGGKLSAELIQSIFLPAFRSAALEKLDDQAIVSINGTRLAITTDSFVVKPLFFPGGDIGSLAVHGTVNDLAMGGARPLFLSVAFIIEEGLSMGVLRRVVISLRDAAHKAGVEVVTGDTKVVEKGSGDQVFINTTGIGLVRPGLKLSSDRACPGDAILVSGFLGDHGIAILSERQGLEFECPVVSDSAALHGLVAEMLDVGGESIHCMRDPTRGGLSSALNEIAQRSGVSMQLDEPKIPVVSDSAPLHGLVAEMLDVGGESIHCMRDPTRGGLSSALNEIAQRSGVSMQLDEPKIPVREAVRGACEMLGLDPLYVANEGKLIAIVNNSEAEKVLEAMRRHPLARDAQMIGRVTKQDSAPVIIRTAYGTNRIVDMLSGDQLPRIC
jgi:hydrogenase expression/formation protein HypE